MPKNQPRIAIVGCGLSGITLAIELKKKLGLRSTVTIYDRADKPGGTWRDNIYPGCACDVPSHWYSLSTDLNPNWSAKYSPQPEIQKYWEGVWRKHNIGQQCKFNTTFKYAEWDDVKQVYRITFTPTGEPDSPYVVEADVFISAIGGFSTPLDSPPDMKGLQDFTGPRFHSANWDYSVDLKNKKVGVIGNGCSAAQFVPKISEDPTTQVINFSRTPSWFFPRDQYKYPAFVKWCFAHVPGVMEVYRRYIAVASDLRWFVWILNFGFLRHYAEEAAIQHIMKTAPAKYHGFLIPTYPFGCKRIIYDPGYLQCLNQPNVELVTDAIDTITAKGIKGKSGKEYDMDVLILGTGFSLTETALGLEVKGRHGKTVTEQWTEQKGPQAYLGTVLSGFPNFYLTLGPNVATGHASVVHSTESQVHYIVEMIRPMVDYGVKSFELKLDAETRYNTSLAKKLDNTVWQGGCKTYYKIGNKVVATYPGLLTEFRWKTRAPVWEHYLQRGGSTRVGVWTRVKSAIKTLFLLIAIIAVRRYGLKKLTNKAILLALTQYSNVAGYVTGNN